MAGNRSENWAKISPARNCSAAGTQFLSAATARGVAKLTSSLARRASVVFVEVKARAGDEFGGGAAAVTGLKQRRIGQMAADFLARRRLLDQPCRFDVVTVDFDDGASARRGVHSRVYAVAFEP